MSVRNPFFIKGYHGAEYFCDRVEETQKLLSAIENGRDVTLMAPRRYGKTGLIKNVFSKLKKNYVPIYLDIFQIQNLTEFTKAFSSRAVSELATPIEKTGKGLLGFFRRCRPTATPQSEGGGDIRGLAFKPDVFRAGRFEGRSRRGVGKGDIGKGVD